MLTEIFTGHTINLADLRAVSPSMRELHMMSPYAGRRILYTEIYLNGCGAIRHNVYVQEVGSTIHLADEADWQAQVDQLDQQLAELTAQWERHLTAKARRRSGDDPAALAGR